jgi:hypothetical protein
MAEQQQESPSKDDQRAGTEESNSGRGESNSGESKGDGHIGLDRSDESQDFVDQSKIDFDPDEGLYSGTAVKGGTEIPGPHLDAESGELEGMDEAREQAEEAGIGPDDTEAAKSPVARAAEAESSSDHNDDGDDDEKA